MQDLISKIPHGYVGSRYISFNTYQKSPPIPPTPPDKYYESTTICKTSSSPTMRASHSNEVLTMPPDSFSDVDAISTSDDSQRIQEFPRQSLLIVEKLGNASFGEVHLCETKGIR